MPFVGSDLLAGSEQKLLPEGQEVFLRVAVLNRDEEEEESASAVSLS